MLLLWEIIILAYNEKTYEGNLYIQDTYFSHILIL